MQMVVELFDGEVVDRQVRAGGHGADPVMDGFGFGGGRDGVDDDVGFRQDALDGFGGGEGDLLGTLEGQVARHGKGEIGEVAGAGAAGAKTVDGEDAIDEREVVKEFAAGRGGGLSVLGRGGIEERVKGMAGETPGDGEDDGGYDEGGDRVGELKSGEMDAFPEVGRGEAEKDRQRGPDVSGEVDSIGGEGVGVGVVGDAAQGAGTEKVDHDRKRQDGEGPERDRQGEVVAEEDAMNCLVDDPDGRSQHEAGFDEGGEGFDFAMAVGVIVVGGAVGGADGEEGDGGGDEVDGGVRGLGQHAE